MEGMEKIVTRIKDSSAWAREVVGLLIIAHIFDVVKRQVKD